MDKKRSFFIGTPLRRAQQILPVFLPFAGCPRQCVFCVQDKQTGVGTARKENGIQDILTQAERRLEGLDACPSSSSRELAFYGGTFTALKPEHFHACLSLFKTYRAQGIITCGRCSTRPDALTTTCLDDLKEAGIDLVELGIQSFDTHALERSQRGYDGETAYGGCKQVQQANLKLGIQLLPGMPGVTPDVFLRDVQQALKLAPAALRFYPCLVPEGSVLARLWQEGKYMPWSLEDTVHTLGTALALAWKAQIPVIRLSVAPEASFDAIVQAGPRHPALGNMIQAAALQQTILPLLQNGNYPDRRLWLPKTCQGFVYGYKGELKPWWAKLGFTSKQIQFHNKPYAWLE